MYGPSPPQTATLVPILATTPLIGHGMTQLKHQLTTHSTFSHFFNLFNNNLFSNHFFSLFNNCILFLL